MTALEGFSARLREARIELHHDQSRFAELGGVKKNTQISYEAGRTPPGIDYLYRLAEHGIDIGYLLTGRRTEGGGSVEQELLLDAFERLSMREREAVMHLVLALAGLVITPADLDAAGQRRATLHDRRDEYRSE